MSYLYVRAVDQKKHGLLRHVQDLAIGAKALVDYEQHERLVKPEQISTEEYRRSLAPLVEYHKLFKDVVYVYSVRIAPDHREYFILDTMNDPEIFRWQTEELGRKKVKSGVFEEYKTPPENALSYLYVTIGPSFVFPFPYTDSFGTFIEGRSYWFDGKNKPVAYVGVDYDLQSYNREINEMRRDGLITLGLSLLVSLVLARMSMLVRQKIDESLDQARRAEAAMREQRDLADKANHAKSELLAIASHDLKNPLSAIAGMASLLLQMKKEEREQAPIWNEAEILGSIKTSAQHMAEIVRGILANEGLEQGGLSFSAAVDDLCGICREILRFNTPAADRKRIKLVAEMPALLESQVDSKLMREAFDNYVSNAIKYSPAGSTVTVSLRLLTETLEMEFSVQDAGPGLSPEDQKKLFRKFQKLAPRPTGDETSTGLGLSIVKTIAALHHGKVGCESQVGHGSRFWIRQPLMLPTTPVVLNDSISPFQI